MQDHGEPAGQALNRQQRLLAALTEFSEVSRKYGVVIRANDNGPPSLEFEDTADGMYAINPNDDGPEFGWIKIPK